MNQTEPDAGLQFAEKSLEILIITIKVSKLLRIPLALIYFKFPQITRIYFIFELLTNAQEAFLMRKDPDFHV